MKTILRILHWDSFWLSASLSLLIGFFKEDTFGAWNWFQILLPILLVLVLFVVNDLIEKNTVQYPYEEEYM